MTTVRVGDRELELGGDHLVELRESTDLVDDEDALRDRLAEDGYLFVRAFHDPDVVRAARRDVLEHMADEGLLDPDAPIEDGRIHAEWFGEEFDMSAASWTHYPNLDELIRGSS